MKKFLGAGSLSAIAAVTLLMVGGSNEALAQQVSMKFPVVKAVLSTPTINPVAAATDLATGAGKSLDQLVAEQQLGPQLDEEGHCLATAVYFESRGEPLEGQLAVANVVLNRAQSGRYPSSWCDVVKQKAQFSFVRHGRFPRIDAGSEAWMTAQAIARIAANRMVEAALPADVLWYHADYCAPKWRKQLVQVNKIGAHVFYRS